MVVGLTVVVLLSIVAVLATTRHFHRRRRQERELEDRRTKRYVSPEGRHDHTPQGSRRGKTKSEEIEMTDDIAAMHEMSAVIASLQMQEDMHDGFAAVNDDVFGEMASSHVQDYVAPPADPKAIINQLEDLDVAFVRAEAVTLMASIGTGGYGQVFKAMRR